MYSSIMKIIKRLKLSVQQHYEYNKDAKKLSVQQHYEHNKEAKVECTTAL